MIYRHTQIGYLLYGILIGIILLYSGITLIGGFEPAAFAIIIVIAAILISFGWLTVEVSAHSIFLVFGIGLVRKTFVTKDIASVQPVKNHWYYGWGIRLWLWPYMWIYNVSGFDAVEIIMKNGRRYRIGTDDPAGLAAAIKQAGNL